MPNSIVEDIQALRIQGAEQIALSACHALSLEAKANATHPHLHQKLLTLGKDLCAARPTEPCLRNAVSYILHTHHHRQQTPQELSKFVIKRAEEAQNHFKNTKNTIIQYAAKKIKNGMIVFTHCHSGTVVDILNSAHQAGKKFTVHNTETRPMMQGRTTAKELAMHHIPVVHFIDSAGRLALKRADIMLIGCDAITSEGKVINKIGTEMFAEIADRYQIPVYCCTNSWKLDPKTLYGFEEKIETRKAAEVWPNPPPGVRIDNHAFELVDPSLITGVISELGVYSPLVFVDEVRKGYPEFFNP